MLISLLAEDWDVPDVPGTAGPPDDHEAATPEPPAAPRKRRRGVTSMEYLVCASFIIIVLISTIQALGITVKGLFTKDATATNTSKQGP